MFGRIRDLRECQAADYTNPSLFVICCVVGRQLGSVTTARGNMLSCSM